MNKKDNNNKQSYILTRETLGMTILLFSALMLIILLTHKLVFASLGGAICTFMYGTFGYASYIVLALFAYLGEWLVFEKKINVSAKNVGVVSLTVFMLFLLFHAVSTRGVELNGYGSYLSQCYYNASNGYAGYTFGGVLAGLFVYPIAKGTTFIGAYVIFSLLTVLCGYLSFLVIKKSLIDKSAASQGLADGSVKVNGDDSSARPDVAKGDNPDNLYSVNDDYEIVKKQPTAAQIDATAQTSVQDTQSQEDDRFSSSKLGRKILFENGEFAAESYRRNMIFSESSYFNHPVQNDGDYLSSFLSGKKPPVQEQTYSEEYSKEVEQKAETTQTPSYVYGDKPVDSLDDFGSTSSTQGTQNSYNIPSDRSTSGQFNSSVETPTNTTTPITSSVVGSYPETKPEDKQDSKSDDTYSLREESTFNSSDLTNQTDRMSTPENVVPTRSEQPPVADVPQHDDFTQIIRRSSLDEADGKDSGVSSSSLFSSLFSSSNSRLPTDNSVEPDTSRLSTRRTERSNASLFDDDADENTDIFADDNSSFNAVGLRGGVDSQPTKDSQDITPTVQPVQTESVKEEPVVKPQPVVSQPQVVQPEPVVEKAPEPEKPKHVWKKYVRPTLDLLDDYPENNNVNTAEIEDSKQIIVETLSNFRIACQVSNVVVGPAITRYDVIIEDRTNIKNALKYKEAIAMALMKENVNAYLNYSKGAISIEVPNSSRTVVGLKGMLASSNFINCKPNTLTFTLGKNVEGQVVCPDITKMPHLLVAGTTGSGKSICLSTLIVSLLYKYGPEELRFILVDPKQVEFISYDKLPHLMINEIIYDVDKAIKALNWAIKEMERRYQLFKEMTENGIATKNLTEYNAHLPEGEEKLPKIVIILDEFGDLMLQAKKDIESRIIRLVQKSRACGIHLILATQRPSVDCITGLIKSNLPTRIGFKVNSFDDARTIFDVGGAEKLLGKGDLYFRSAENPELARIQGCFIDTHEVQRVTDFVKKNNETYFDESVSDFINTVEEDDNDSSGGDEGGATDNETKIDDTFIKALKFCVTSNQASVSMIQRRFPVGYIKACKIIDWMENMNYVTQAEGSKPRKVLLSKEEFIKTYGDVDD